MDPEKRAKFMQGRMAESARVAKMSDSRKYIYPYTWLKYYDTKEFVDKVIIISVVRNQSLVLFNMLSTL